MTWILFTFLNFALHVLALLLLAVFVHLYTSCRIIFHLSVASSCTASANAPVTRSNGWFSNSLKLSSLAQKHTSRYGAECFLQALISVLCLIYSFRSFTSASSNFAFVCCGCPRTSRTPPAPWPHSPATCAAWSKSWRALGLSSVVSFLHKQIQEVQCGGEELNILHNLYNLL